MSHLRPSPSPSRSHSAAPSLSAAAAAALLLLSVVVPLARPASAQAPDAAPAPQPAAAPAAAAAAAAAEADDAAVAPYIDEGTFLVGRLDVDRVDHEAFATFMEQFIETIMKAAPIPAQVRPQVQAEMTRSIGTAKTWLTNMSEAGGKHVYVLFDQEDATGGGGAPPGIVVPVAEGGDVDRVHGLLSAGLPEVENLQHVGRSVAYAKPAAMERAKARLTPAGAARVERPDLASALAGGGGAGGEAPLRFALVPGEASRRSVEENLDKLPDVLGGGDAKLVSRGVRWATLSLSLKPAAVAHVTVKAGSAEQAKALMDALAKGLEAAGPLVAALPQGDAVAAKVGEIKPKLVGDTITLTIDPTLLQWAIIGIQGRAEVQAEVVVDGDAKEEKPAKSDDGGL